MRIGQTVGIWMAILLVVIVGIFCWAVARRDGSSIQNIPRIKPVTPVARVTELIEPPTDEGHKQMISVAPPSVVHESDDALLFQTLPVSESDSSIPLSVREIVAQKTDSMAASRLAVVHALGDQLSARERGALYSFLLDPNRAEDLTPDQEYVLVNEIMKKLRQQQYSDPALGAVLVSIYRDGRQELVVRDYALQHLGEWCLANGLDEDLELAFREALLERRSSIAGTALIALNKLAGEKRELSVGMVWNAALSLASDESANEGARATAMAICGIWGVVDALPVARKLAWENSISLRLASIAYVGNYGQEEDQAWLTEIMTDAPGIIVASAKTAIDRIAARNDRESLIVQRKGEL